MSALQGVRVVDLGQFYLAPYCATLLARLGADVIKVESPQGDPYRRLPTAGEDGISLQFQFINSGKRTVKLDLRTDGGKEILRRLAAWADVLVQNLAPGAMDRFDVGWDALSAVNPRLIMASGTGFGSFGPYAGQPAMDLTIQARTAVMSTTGFEDGPPVRTGPSVVDFMGGTHLAAGVLAALFHRTLTGRGQHVEVALQDAIIPSLTSNIAGYLATGGEVPERTGNRHGGLAVAPYNAYQACDGWVTILCPTDAHWERLCVLLDDPQTSDPRIADLEGRCRAMDLIDAIVGRWTLRHSTAELEKALGAANIPFAAVVTLPELLVDPHVAARRVIRTVADARGSFTTLGSPIFLSDSPTEDPERAHGHGEDTDGVLTELLGFSQEEIHAFRAAGAV